jgi:hypothetical protein
MYQIGFKPTIPRMPKTHALHRVATVNLSLKLFDTVDLGLMFSFFFPPLFLTTMV